ncbi:hypothetical protein [Wielerella bovis]|uniref:hypothetical protein n=1 Tax=Wielerella bovis TaxID=2917790 RepID=UPI002019DDF0|nr:hypothetical protein [Wielerella bovis]MCG7657989.1 hypothetical protein [Wielerella bovis]MCG7660211.1 hypothetical protein [Wielerella bovis]
MKNHILLLLLALSACSTSSVDGVQKITVSSPASTHLNDSMESGTMTSQDTEDEFAPNGTQKIMDEIKLLEKQTPVDYLKITEKLQQAATLQNYFALSDLTVIYGMEENATVYGVKINPLTACTLALYNNHLYGDVNKGHLDLYCNGEKLTKAQSKQAEQFSEMLIKHPNRLSELW